MCNRIFVIFLTVLGLSACTQSRMVTSDPSELEENDRKYAFGEKCKNAKYQLDKTVQEGQLSDLRHLKRNIELYCVWRRN